MIMRFCPGLTCLSVVMLATIPSTVRAGDKPTTAKKPLSSTGGVPKAVTDIGSETVITAVAFSPSGKMLYTSSSADRRTIGVTVSAADPVLRTHLPQTKGKLGLVVTRVVKGSPAAKAGIQPNDILLTLAGKDLSKVSDLTVTIQKAKSPMKGTLLRRAMNLSISIVVPKKHQQKSMVIWAVDGGPKFTIGAHTVSADSSLIAQLVLPPKTGLVIRRVDAKSPAAKAGLQQHDVILTAGGACLSKPADLGKALDKSAGKPLVIGFVRSGRKQTCTVTATKRMPAGMRIWKFDARRHLIQTQMTPATDLKSQVDRLSRQIDQLRKTLDALKKSLPARKSKKSK